MAASPTSSRWPSLRSGWGSAALVIVLAACSSGEEPVREKPHVQKRGDGASNQGSVPAETVAPLLVVVDGRDAPAWTGKTFDGVERFTVSGDNGSRRAVWSLRKLAATLVGPSARVVRVHSSDATLEISPERWRANDAAPALRRTGRGELKFQLIGEDGRPSSQDVQLPGITRIELVLDEPR